MTTDGEDRAVGSESGGTAFRPLGRGELLAIFGFWTFMALLGAANDVVDPRAGGARWAGLGESLTMELFEAFLWAALTPLIFWLSARARFESSRWVKPALVLAAAGLACAVFTDIAEDIFEIYALGAPPGSAGTSPIHSLLRLWFLNDLMIFLAVLAAGFAREYFFRYQTRQDEAVRLEARAAVLEGQLAEARLEALRMQVNPHFLFNTLHAVSSLVHRDPDGVRRMIAKLASLLRTTLRGGSGAEVPLEQELEFLEDYLEIMQVRFQGRLDVEFDLAPGILQARVPNLILQPLVENAFKHAVGQTEGHARVVLQGAADGDTLILAVLDTGPGLPESPDEAAEAGIGIRNVRERLARLYGDRGRLAIADRPGGGVRAEIRLPLRFDATEGADATGPTPQATAATRTAPAAAGTREAP